jgi:asparagine synthase (glutamine-hydrolysing)
MCGICGVAAAPGLAVDPSLIRQMCDVMAHRGPDDEGVLVRGAVGLGMRRLSIIDPAGGHQPLSNEEETVSVVFNGEIYNHPDLRQELTGVGRRFTSRSDTEVLLRAYEHWGEASVEHLNGMFAFAIWDRREAKMLLARDRVGIKPLYYTTRGGSLVFASELKSLLCVRTLKRDVDLSALDDYLRFDYVPTPRTIIAGIYKLPPGHMLTWQIEDRECQLRQYWDVDLAASEQRRPPKGIADHTEELRAVLQEAVRKEMISDVPLGVFLSGGIDSSAVAAMATHHTRGALKSFTIGFSDPSFDESNHARAVAAHLGTDHQVLVLEPSMLSDLVPEITSRLDEPFADPSIIPTYLLSRFARQHVKVALSGDGGDELFAGYPTLLAHRAAPLYQRLPRFARQTLIPSIVNRLPVSRDNLSLDFKAKRFVNGASLPLAERHVRWLGSFDAEERAGLLSAEVHAELLSAGAPDVAADHLTRQALREPLNRILYLDMKTYLESDILVKLDRASMMASLEARVPLLNADVVSHVTALPLDLKLRGLRSKYLLKKAMRGLLPDATLRRGKKGFGIPVARWFRGPLREELLAALSRERITGEGFFDYGAVRRLVDDHLDGRRDNRKQLWSLFVFQRWYGAHASGRCSTRTAERQRSWE